MQGFLCLNRVVYRREKMVQESVDAVLIIEISQYAICLSSDNQRSNLKSRQTNKVLHKL